MAVRGVRGAIVVEKNEVESILTATRQLLEGVLAANPSLKTKDLVSVIFTVTPDLYAEYPAKAARSLGWTQVPLLCVQEMGVAGSLERCIRVLLHWNTDLNQEEVKHVYLGKAACLRPDLVSR